MTEENNHEEETIKKPKRAHKKPRVLFWLITIVICALAYYGIEQVRNYETTDDAYIETHTVQVSPKVSGHIVKIYVKDNQEVKKGDLVAEIDPTDYKVKLTEMAAKYDATIKKQKSAVAASQAADSKIKLAQKDLQRYKNLYNEGSASKQEYDDAKTNYDNAKAELVEANENVLSKNNQRVADSDLKQIGAQKRQASLNLSYTKIYAPQSGSVINKTAEPGAYVDVGQPLFTIVPQKVWVIANFKESQLEGMTIGQPVEIKVDSYSHKRFKGKIDSIQRSSGAKSSLFPPENAVGSFVKIVQRIPVKIVFTEKIDKTKYILVPGMSVVPKVRVKKITKS